MHPPRPSRRSRMLEDRARRVRPRHVGPGEVGADTGRLTEVGVDKFSASQHSTSEVRFGEIHTRKVGIKAGRLDDVSPTFSLRVCPKIT